MSTTPSHTLPERIRKGTSFTVSDLNLGPGWTEGTLETQHGTTHESKDSDDTSVPLEDSNNGTLGLPRSLRPCRPYSYDSGVGHAFTLVSPGLNTIKGRERLLTRDTRRQHK